jgi:hypothetical protein
MAEPMSDKHFEDKFEFPLWNLIKQLTEKKDISHHGAALEVISESVKTICYDDAEFERKET